jgi:predicted AAA+ superfamily ATPase
LLNSFTTDLDLRIDKGILFENWVFTEINKTLPIHSGFNFWRSKARAEVDFVIEYGNQLIGVETKFSALKTTKITRSTRSFIEAYQPDEFVVLNRALEDTVVINKTIFLFLTPTGFSDWIRDRFTGS